MKERVAAVDRKYKNVPKKRDGQSCMPKIDYETARRSWFRHQDQTYCIEYAPPSILRSAILAVAGWRFGKSVESILFQEVIDMAERWFLLCTMIERETPMPLYRSREEAEKAS